MSFGAGSRDSGSPLYSSHLSYNPPTRYRAFAELLEHGTGSTLILPTHKPAMATPTPAPPGLAELDALRVLGLNPANALQHPGFYYYMAAQATERRRAQFLAMLSSMEASGTNFPGFANEKKVDHFGVVIEVRHCWPVCYGTKSGVDPSYTRKHTNFSKSTRRCPTAMARGD